MPWFKTTTNVGGEMVCNLFFATNQSSALGKLATHLLSRGQFDTYGSTNSLANHAIIKKISEDEAREIWEKRTKEERYNEQ